MKKIILISSLTLLMPLMARAQHDDFGIWYSLGAEKKINRQLAIGAESEFRTRNDSKTADRWSVGINAEYKIVKGLKASVGYNFLYDNNAEKLSYNYDNTGAVATLNNWRPSYWGARHRVTVSLQGSKTFGRLGVSLRERWQYTYRPEKTTQRFDFDNSQWEDKVVKGKAKSVLRSRLQLDYDIPNWKADPYGSVELANAWNIQKIRYTLGADYKIQKTHVFSLYYRYQDIRKDDFDGEPDMHVIGVGYKFKF